MADLADGETTEMQGSGKKPYVLKNTGGVYSCSCPAWRNQSFPIEQRTCKHLRKLRGDEAEQARIGNPLPVKKAEKDAGPALLLAHAWKNDSDLTGWWMSEKLDGVRAYWDGKQFLSRQGNVFHAPDWFLEGLPETPLDGELWLERKKFQRTVGIVKRQDKSDLWKELHYVVFDAPEMEAPFEDRLKYIDELIASGKLTYAQALDHFRCEGLSHMEQELKRVEGLGGEGLMLREPGSRYETGRSTSLLKVKTFYDAEARVIDYTKGRGRHKGRVGALVVEMPSGDTFSIGTGLSDKQRENPPEIGSVVSYRYQELTTAGIPRFPSYIGERPDSEGSDPPDTGRKSTSKQPTKKTSPKKSEPKPETGTTRLFHYDDEKSSKFWEITLAGSDVTVRYGKQGANGTTKVKSFDDDTAAGKHAEKLIEQKTDKGYVEVTGE